jgi:hypothetical protein
MRFWPINLLFIFIAESSHALLPNFKDHFNLVCKNPFVKMALMKCLLSSHTTKRGKRLSIFATIER